MRVKMSMKMKVSDVIRGGVQGLSITVSSPLVMVCYQGGGYLGVDCVVEPVGGDLT